MKVASLKIHLKKFNHTLHGDHNIIFIGYSFNFIAEYIAYFLKEALSVREWEESVQIDREDHKN